MFSFLVLLIRGNRPLERSGVDGEKGDMVTSGDPMYNFKKGSVETVARASLEGKI